MTRHPSEAVPAGVSRRGLLRGLAGTGALLALPAAAGCDHRADPNLITMSTNRAEPAQREGIAATLSDFEAATGYSVEVNAVDSNAFQQNINNYLQGTPDDVIAWFAGYRTRYFADRGLITDLSDIWRDHFRGAFTDQVRDLCTAADGRQYLIPDSYYPWAVFYRKSVFAEHGYEPPSTRSEFVDLCERMRDDGIIPLAYGNREGWPAMGTFDQLNLRLNGPDFHLELLNGQHSWESTEVKDVFAAWRELLPYHQPDALGRGFDQAQQALLRREAGMLLSGLFLTQVFPEGEDRDDLDLFPFPEFDSAIGTGAVEAPTDGFMLAAEPRNPDAARQLLHHLGTRESQETYAQIDPQALPVHTEADTSGLNELDRKALDMILNADALTQFMDRDTRPDFASVVMIPALQRFLGQPDDVDDLTASIERQKRSIFG